MRQQSPWIIFHDIIIHIYYNLKNWYTFSTEYYGIKKISFRSFISNLETLLLYNCSQLWAFKYLISNRETLSVHVTREEISKKWLFDPLSFLHRIQLTINVNTRTSRLIIFEIYIYIYIFLSKNRTNFFITVEYSYYSLD